MLYNIILVHDGWNGFESVMYTFNISMIEIMMLIITHFLLLLILVPQMMIPETGQTCSSSAGRFNIFSLVPFLRVSELQWNFLKSPDS